MNIVLHEPGIALNTGNIGRTCAATGTGLHLIRPFGFRITEKEIRRAGMDYWNLIDLHEYIDYGGFLEKHPELVFGDVNMRPSGGEKASACRAAEAFSGPEAGSAPETKAGVTPEQAAPDSPGPRLWFATTKARRAYTDVQFGPDDYIMLGNESRGIPEELLLSHPGACIRIPMWGEIRSLNLANAAAIILYEALRQNDFMGLKMTGELHRLRWDS